jgi:predicted alpha/beta hydrolase
MEFKKLQSKNGITVPVAFFEAQGDATATILMQSAMGVRARFYRAFAENLSAAGINVALMEQRGHGESPYRPSRSSDFDCADFIYEDIPTAIEYVRKAVPDPSVPLYIAGHSMGGHMAASYAALHPDDIDGLMLFACGLPCPHYFPKKEARLIRSLLKLLPFLLFVFGHFPGKRVGFADREFRSFMLDWRRIAKTGNYDFMRVEADIESAAAKFNKPVAVFSIENDTFAPIDAVLAVADKFKSAPIAKRRMLAADLKGHTGHFDWVKGMDEGVKKVLGVISHFNDKKEK